LWIFGYLLEQEDGVKSAGNIRVWAESNIRAVGKEIVERIKTASKTLQGVTSNGQLCRRVRVLFGFSRIL